MQVLPIDLESIIAIVMGISIILIPVAGLTARFALKPTVEAIARLFEHKGLEETVGILERRMSLLEQQMESMDTSLSRIAEAVEFDYELREGRSPTRSLRHGGGAPGAPEEDTETQPGATDTDAGTPDDAAPEAPR